MHESESMPLRTLRCLIRRDRRRNSENHFVWCATTAGPHVRFWRYSVFGEAEEVDPMGEPALGADYLVQQAFQGTDDEFRAWEGEWVRNDAGDRRAKPVFRQWRTYEVERRGALHMRYAPWEMDRCRHAFERLHRPHTMLGRYRVFRPAMEWVFTLTEEPERDWPFLVMWLEVVKNMGPKLASGDHVTQADAETKFEAFFYADQEDVDLEGYEFDPDWIEQCNAVMAQMAEEAAKAKEEAIEAAKGGKKAS
jgi:hypothetical protein